MNRADRQRRTPGAFLRAIASRLFDRPTAERFLFPAIADLQHEARRRLDAGRLARLAILLRDYVAFWRAFATCLVTRGATGFASWRPLVVSMLFMAAMTGALMYGPASRASKVLNLDARLLWLLLPQALAVTVPCSVLVFGFLGSSRRIPEENSASPRGAFVRSVLLFSVAAAFTTFVIIVWLVPACNQAYRERAHWIAAQRAGGVVSSGMPVKGPAEMTIAELTQARLALPETQSARYGYYLHQKFTIPLAAVAFGLITIAVVRRERESRRPVWRALGLFAVTLFGYYVLHFKGRSLALGLVVPAWIGAWSPPVLFSTLALLRLRRRDRQGTGA